MTFRMMFCEWTRLSVLTLNRKGYKRHVAILNTLNMNLQVSKNLTKKQFYGGTNHA